MIWLKHRIGLAAVEQPRDSDFMYVVSSPVGSLPMVSLPKVWGGEGETGRGGDLWRFVEGTPWKGHINTWKYREDKQNRKAVACQWNDNNIKELRHLQSPSSPQMNYAPQ